MRRSFRAPASSSYFGFERPRDEADPHLGTALRSRSTLSARAPPGHALARRRRARPATLPPRRVRAMASNAAARFDSPPRAAFAALRGHGAPVARRAVALT